MVGALNYAANHTRPDIAFATSRLASVVSRPSHEQLEAAKRLVRYVSATASVGLEYSAVRQRLQRGAADLSKGEMLLTCYTDASFNSVKADGTSIGGGGGGGSELLLLVRSAAAARARVVEVVEVAAVVVEAAAGVVVGAAVGVVEAVEVVAAVGLDLGVEAQEVASDSSSSVGARPSRPSSFTCGKLHTQHRCFSRLDDAWRSEFGEDVECPRWADLLQSGVAIFDLDFDVILFAMYAFSTSAEGDCYRCVPPGRGIATVALGASESCTLPGTVSAQALHTFTLDSGASRCFFRDSTTLTPLPAPIPVRLADPSGGPVVARSSTVLPCPAVPSGSLSGLHLPSFSTNLTLLWHHRLGHPSLPRLRGMHSRLLVSGLPRSLPPLPPLPAPPCLLCVEGRQRAAPHSSSFPPTTAPLQTLHMDVWGPARDLPVLRLHSDKGGEFSSHLLRDFCHGEGILQSFTLPDSPQQNGIAERRIGLVMEVARTRDTGATGTSGVGDAGAEDHREPGAAGAGDAGAGAGGAGVGSTGGGGAGAAGAGAVDSGAGGAGGTVRPRPYFLPLLQQVLGVLSSTSLTPPLLVPPPDQTQSPLLSASPLPAPSPYTEQCGGLTERRDPASCPVSPVRTARRVPHSRPPPVPSTHAMALRPSSVPLRVPLPAPPKSSLPEVPDPESDSARAASPSASCLLATAVTDPSFESATASALVAELLDFAAACRLDYTTALVTKSESASPPSVGGECALGTDVLEDRQEDFECLAAYVPRFTSMLLAPEGDPDAPDIPTPRSYEEAITRPYSSQWQAAMDVEMAFWKSTGTYDDEVPPSRANIVDGMWIFRVKRPPGSPPAFKARYVARGFSQRQGVDYFQTFPPTPKMTTLRVSLHVAAQRDYELHSLDFTTAFLRGSLHEEIWLRRPPSFTALFPAVYVDGLVFATADTEALTLVKSELQKRHTCTDLGELRSYLGLQITRDRAQRTITLAQSNMSVETSGLYPELVGCLITSGMGLVLGGRGPLVLTGHANASWADDSATQRSSQGYTFSLGSGFVSWRSTRSSSVLSSSCEAEIYAGAMATQKLP
ncbi:unnamed protein product [Closterium sp. NIES-53]